MYMLLCSIISSMSWALTLPDVTEPVQSTFTTNQMPSSSLEMRHTILCHSLFFQKEMLSFLNSMENIHCIFLLGSRNHSSIRIPKAFVKISQNIPKEFEEMELCGFTTQGMAIQINTEIEQLLVLMQQHQHSKKIVLVSMKSSKWQEKKTCQPCRNYCRLWIWQHRKRRF